MEKIPDSPNFHEVSEERKGLRKTVKELGDNEVIIEKHYKKPLETVEARASDFKIANFGGLTGAKQALGKQKTQYEEKVLQDGANIDYEAILQTTPEIGEVQKVLEDIADLKDFRMRRMFELLSPDTSMSVRKRNEAVLITIKEEIKSKEEVIEHVDPLVLRQTELVEYRENLAESGHICITPGVERDLEAIGDRMLTGKPMFLHGPTGTGKTSLARYAAKHFTGKDPEMIYCSPQTRESTVFGKTGIRPARGGSIETVEIYGPLVQAMIDGKAVIFDEFTALPKEQMVFINGVFNKKVGDSMNIVGNGIVEIAPGFQMIFTANLKSEKNPERQDLPPEIKREFEQNNLEVKYTPPDESYDIMLSRLLNRDGTLDMSFYDLNTTLPNLCKVMAEIQESYTNETDKDVARLAGALDASGKTYSLKDLVMTQGSVEAILQGWLVEKQTGKKERSFSEFLDDRFKTALTFKAYPKEDRILAAKILASKGFLLTLDAKDLDLPQDIFKLNTIKQMRGEEALSELRKESGAVRHLTLKEVAELDPFGKRAEILRAQAEALLSGEVSESDPFLSSLNKKMGKIFGKENRVDVSEISINYTYTNPQTNKVEHQETIDLSIETKLTDFISFYKTTSVDLPPDFEDTMRDIWERNFDEIQKSIEENGFNDILIIPSTPDIGDLSKKMKMESGYYDGINSNTTVQTLDGIPFTNQNSDKPRIILYHNRTLPEVQTTTGLDVHLNITAEDAMKLFKQHPDKHMTLPDFLILEAKIFKRSNIHISDWNQKSGQWLNTQSGTLLVCSCWRPGDHRLAVHAYGSTNQFSSLGVRPSRCFY